MLTADFESNGILGKVKRANKSLDAFDAALYTKKLYQVYGSTRNVLATAFVVTESTNDKGESKLVVVPNQDEVFKPEIRAAITIFDDIDTFSQIAPRVVEMHADGLSWPASRATADEVDAAFRLWLGDEDLQKAINDACQSLDHPNGPLNGKLTEEQKQDSFLLPQGVATSNS